MLPDSNEGEVAHYVNRDTFLLPTYPLRQRVLRAFWSLVWRFLFRTSPRPAFAWRRMLLRAFGADIAERAKVYPTTRIWAPWNVSMGVDSCFGPDVDVYSMARISLGARATVSQRSFLCCGTHQVHSPTFDLITLPITIGANAWVAAEAFIGPGVVVGDWAVIAARACVVRNVPEKAIVAGVPAQHIGIRDIG